MAERGFDGIGDESADAARAASFMRVVDEFRRVVSHWRYPPATLRRVTADGAERTYQNIREGVRDNVLDLLRMTRQLVEARRWDAARAMIERADERWTRWIQQVDAMMVPDPAFDQTTADRISQMFREIGGEIMELPARIPQAVLGTSWGPAAAAVGILWLLSQRR